MEEPLLPVASGSGPLAGGAAMLQRKNLTVAPYLSPADRTDIQEVYERLDVGNKGGQGKKLSEGGRARSAAPLHP